MSKRGHPDPEEGTSQTTELQLRGCPTMALKQGSRKTRRLESELEHDESVSDEAPWRACILLESSNLLNTVHSRRGRQDGTKEYSKKDLVIEDRVKVDDFIKDFCDARNLADTIKSILEDLEDVCEETGTLVDRAERRLKARLSSEHAYKSFEEVSAVFLDTGKSWKNLTRKAGRLTELPGERQLFIDIAALFCSEFGQHAHATREALAEACKGLRSAVSCWAQDSDFLRANLRCLTRDASRCAQKDMLEFCKPYPRRLRMTRSRVEEGRNAAVTALTMLSKVTDVEMYKISKMKPDTSEAQFHWRALEAEEKLSKIAKMVEPLLDEQVVICLHHDDELTSEWEAIQALVMLDHYDKLSQYCRVGHRSLGKMMEAW